MDADVSVESARVAVSPTRSLLSFNGVIIWKGSLKIAATKNVISFWCVPLKKASIGTKTKEIRLHDHEIRMKSFPTKVQRKTDFCY